MQGCSKGMLYFPPQSADVAVFTVADACSAALFGLLRIFARNRAKYNVVCRWALRYLSRRLVLCSELFFAIFAVGLRALRSAGILCQNCFTMPSCCLTKCWGFPLRGRALRRETVHGMGPEWALVRKKGWRSPTPVVRSHSFITTYPSMVVNVIWECKVGREKVLLTIFFFSLLIFRRLFPISLLSFPPGRERPNLCDCLCPRIRTLLHIIRLKSFC